MHRACKTFKCQLTEALQYNVVITVCHVGDVWFQSCLLSFTESSLSFTVFPELPSYILSPSSSSTSPLCSQDFQPTPSAARKLLLECNPLPFAGTAPRSSAGSPGPFHTDFMGSVYSARVLPPRFSANSPRVGSRQFRKGARSSLPSNFVVESSRQGDGRCSPVRSFALPYQRTDSGQMFAPHSAFGGRLANTPSATTGTDPFLLEKLLHTFQTMRFSVDNISQELKVLNSHLGNLSLHFGALPHLSHLP